MSSSLLLKGINLKAAGVESDNKGHIVINDQFTTSQENIALQHYLNIITD